MEKQLTLAEKVQNDINDIHEDFSLLISNINIKTKSLKEDEEDKVNIYNELRNMGLRNSQVGKLDNINKSILNSKENSNRIKNLKQNYEKLSNYFPQNKIIEYSKLITVLEKYNLYIVPLIGYNGIIPEDNAKELVTYKNNIKKFNEMDDNYIFNRGYYPERPICAQSGTLDNDNNCFYICCPLRETKKKDRVIVGKEVFYDSEYHNNKKLKFNLKLHDFSTFTDPIIVKPINLDSGLEQEKFFQVGTAWGEEASDPLVFANNFN